jgi:hypothetical protein
MNPTTLAPPSDKDLRILDEGARALAVDPGDAQGPQPAGILVMHPVR